MSYNILLDKLPQDYKGYLIRTDFRIGIQISTAMEDKNLSQRERLEIAAGLLFGRGIPDPKTAVEGVGWFLRCGADIRTDLPKDDSPQSIYFDFDSGRIWASVKATYGIDLHTTNMHWFEFCHLLSSIGKDTALANAVDVRNHPVKGTKGEERARIVKAKLTLTPPVEKTDAEKAQEESLKRDMENLMGAVTNARS